MKEQYQFRIAKLRTYLRMIEGCIVRSSNAVQDLQLFDNAPMRFDMPDDSGHYEPVQPGQHWGHKQQWACFRGRIDVPEHWPTGQIELRFRHDPRYLEPPVDDNFPAGPEGQVFIDGQRVGAIDNGHHQIRHSFTPGSSHDMRAIFFAGRCACRHLLAECAAVWIDAATRSLYYDLRVALDIAEQCDESSVTRERILRAVDAAISTLDTREIITTPAAVTADIRDPGNELFYRSVDSARETFSQQMKDVAVDADPATVICTGHAHIDLAWLWPIKQTRHKCVRTFATQLRLIDQYPGFVFQQSSPQAYAWIERDAPDLFEAIKQRIADGRWEADGASWCEMDTNITSGESLVRQLLYGRRYYREKLGVDSRMLWIPDVFGYSAALPQILKLAGVDTFVTQKISWNQYNRFPYQSFRWRGLDGSEVVTHFPLNTYNGLTGDDLVGEICRQWDEYTQKPLLAEPLLPFGWGDGGGGPTEHMLEITSRMTTPLASTGVPAIAYGKAGDLARRIAERSDELPAWDGELYLEYHRGTYTSQAWLKRMNRKNEIRLHNLECISSMALQHGHAWDKQKVDALWQDLLLMQFHDILPGSSVGEVYDEVRPMQDAIASQTDTLTSAATETLTKQIDTSGFKQPLVLLNTLSWDRNDPIQLPDGTWRDGVTIPALGWTVIDQDASKPAEQKPKLSANAEQRVFESPFWRVRLNEQGEIVELLDLSRQRQIIPEGATANAWQVFEDRPMNFDAWDIDLYYQDHPLPGPSCKSIRLLTCDQVRLVVELCWDMPAIGNNAPSTIQQQMILYASHPRIDFVTSLDWHEHHQLLKVAFPTNIRATNATYEIQFGHVQRPTHRNTPWDLAQFENCAHRFVDLSEHGYGVALLNDCRYGHDVHENTIRLTCVKCAQAPDAAADQGRHEFTYSLLPHTGSFQSAGVIQAAAELNTPAIVRDTSSHDGTLPANFSYANSSNPAVIVDTVKPAEDGNGVILRLYEAFGSRARTTISLADVARRVTCVNLLEEPFDDQRNNLEHTDKQVTLELSPFEIVSLRVET